MKNPWGKTVRGRFGSQVDLVDGRHLPKYPGWWLLAIGPDENWARVALTRRGLERLRDACEEALSQKAGDAP